MPSEVNRSERIFRVNDLELHAIHWRQNKPHSKVDAKSGDKRNVDTLKTLSNNDVPIICLHGWLDNAASFERLAPELAARGHELLALDFAGNGKSTHRTLHGYYNIWDDLIDIEAVLAALGWREFSIIGHSRGAMVGALFASTLPTGLNGLVLLDGMLPPVTDVTTLPEQLSEFLTSRQAALAKSRRNNVAAEKLMNGDYSEKDELRCLSSLEEAWKKRRKHCDLDFQDMKPLLQRALKPAGHASDGSPYLKWTHDQRWLSRSLYRLTAADRVDVLERIRCPTYMLAATEGRVTAELDALQRELQGNFKLIDIERHAGRHHFHMQAEHYQSIAERIHTWWLSRFQGLN